MQTGHRVGSMPVQALEALLAGLGLAVTATFLRGGLVRVAHPTKARSASEESVSLEAAGSAALEQGRKILVRLT